MAKLRHPGVTIMRPRPAREWIDPETKKLRRSGAINWRLRFMCPTEGKYRYETLPETETDPETGLGLRRTRAHDRERMAVLKYEELQTERVDNKRRPGRARARGTQIDEAIDLYFDDHPDLKDSTRDTMRIATRILRREDGEVEGPDGRRGGHGGAHIVAHRGHQKTEERGRFRRGQRAWGSTRRQEASIQATNQQEIRHVKTVVSHLRKKHKMFHRLEIEDLDDCFELRGARFRHQEARDPGRRHRAESGGVPSPRPTDVLPHPRREDARVFARLDATVSVDGALLLPLLLTGMRRGEALALTWGQINLDAG